MGIPFYYSYLIKKFNLDIICKLNFKVNYLFLDSNSIIYDSCKDYESDKNIYIKVCKKLSEYLDLLTNKDAYIAFDGLAPYAKIIQQRSRRYKSSITKLLLNINSKWDSCSITPGTDFLNNFNIYLNKYKFNKKYNIYITDSSEEGEGEHKIFNYIRNNSDKLKNENIILYGLDADLIMLSLIHVKYVKNIYLYRETPEFIKNFNINMNVNDEYLIDINQLKTVIEENCNINDYIFLCFMLGNDFMPHFPTINIRKNGLQLLLSIYSKLNLKLINEKNEIEWNSFRILVAELVKLEKNEFKNIYNNLRKRSVNTFETNEDVLNNLPQIEKDIEYIINPNHKDWKYNYYKELFDIDINYDKCAIKNICVNYIEGLEWNYKYYVGLAIDNNWHYKYNYPPLLEDLINFIPFYNIEYIKYNKNIFTTEMQLCYVLPLSSLNLLPSELKNKLPNYWYKDNCKIIWAYCKYFWESHPILPNIDLNMLKNIVTL